MCGGCFCVGVCGMCGDLFAWGGVGLQGMVCSASVRTERRRGV